MTDQSPPFSDNKNSNNEFLSEEERKKYGYDLYPERRSEARNFASSDFLLKKTSDYVLAKIECQNSILNAIERNPLVKILLGALKSAGCPINLKRHVSCEECSSNVSGGYDQEFNQVVLCQNSYKVRKMADIVLVHELVHMYDYCVGEMDLKNMEHLACTEIRAANLAHCSFMSSWMLGQSSPINIKNTHQYCVKVKAAQSLMMARNIDFPTAMIYIDKVFNKCYNDLEPIGRRIRRNSSNPSMAHNDAKYFGYLPLRT